MRKVDTLSAADIAKTDGFDICEWLQVDDLNDKRWHLTYKDETYSYVPGEWHRTTARLLQLLWSDQDLTSQMIAKVLGFTQADGRGDKRAIREKAKRLELPPHTQSRVPAPKIYGRRPTLPSLPSLAEPQPRDNNQKIVPRNDPFNL